jgi:serine/threonine-protein kinase
VLTLLAVFALGAVMLGINTAASEPGAPPDTTAAEATAPAASTGAPPASAGAPPSAGAPLAPTAAAEPFPARGRFVGEARTANGAVPVSITVDGERAKVYVCDNRWIEAWLQGSARDGLVDARGRGANHLTGRHEGTQITGSVQVTGYPEWSFTAQATRDPSAGVYRASGGGRTTGWIVQDSSGRQVGLSHDASGAVSPAPAIDPSALPPGAVAVDGSTDVLGR